MSEHQIIIPEVERIGREAELGADSVVALCNAFAPHFQEFHSLAQQAKEIGQDEPKRARDMRLKVRQVRIACENTHKDQKADSLRRGRAIDGIKNVLLLSLVPVEEGLDAIEKAEELRAAAKREALKQARAAEVAPLAGTTFYDLGGMPDAQYAELLAGLKAAYTAKIAAQEAAAKAEAESKAAEDAERKWIVEENARLAKIAAEEREAREASERAAAQAKAESSAREKTIRDEAERKAAAERAEAARLAKIEADKREAAEREIREKASRERIAAEEKAAAALAAERAERAKIQSEIDAKAKAEADRISKEQAAAKRAAAAPDQEKVRLFADVISNLDVPELSDVSIQKKIQDQINAMHRWLVTLSTKIGE